MIIIIKEMSLLVTHDKRLSCTKAGITITGEETLIFNGYLFVMAIK